MVVSPNKFKLPVNIKQDLSFQMERWYLTGCCVESRYRYLRVSLLIAFEACVQRIEHWCLMHMIVTGQESLKFEEVMEVCKCFNFREITDSIINNGTFPPNLIDIF